jgi:hypothetical protein
MSTLAESPLPAGSAPSPGPGSGCHAAAAAAGGAPAPAPAPARAADTSDDVYNNEYNQFMVRAGVAGFDRARQPAAGVHARVRRGAAAQRSKAARTRARARGRMQQAHLKEILKGAFIRALRDRARALPQGPQ